MIDVRKRDSVLMESLDRIDRQDGEQLRIELLSYKGAPYMRLYLWNKSDNFHKSITVRMGEAQRVIRAIQAGVNNVRPGSFHLEPIQAPRTEPPPQINPHLVPPWEDLPETSATPTLSEPVSVRMPTATPWPSKPPADLA